MSDWMPIDTALRDRTHILLKWEIPTSDGVIIFLGDGAWHEWYPGRPGYSWGCEYFLNGVNYEPTHWMPIQK